MLLLEPLQLPLPQGDHKASRSAKPALRTTSTATRPSWSNESFTAYLPDASRHAAHLRHSIALGAGVTTGGVEAVAG